MDTSSIFKNDLLELCGKKFYYSVREVDGPLDVFKPHAHNHYELYYLTRGRRNYFVANNIFTICTGDIILIPPGIIHKTTSVSSYGHKRILLNFVEEYFPKNIEEDISNLFSDYHISIPETKADEVDYIFKKLENEYNNTDEYSSEAIKNIMSELFIKLLRISKETINIKNKTGKYESKIKNTLELLKKDISANITVDYAAEVSGLSKSHFEKLFKELTGFTFIDYLNMQRLLKSQKLLAKTSKSITDIAFECGFNSSNYFTTVFKKYSGLTPLKFRKKENENIKL